MPATDPDLRALLAASFHTAHGLAGLPPERCAATLGLDSLAISLLNRSGLELLWYTATDAAGIALEDLQYTLGEGPTVEAARTGRPVLVPDLHAEPDHRWPALLPAARAHPLRAVIALPLQLGVLRLGALAGHRATPGRLTRDQMADALALAEAATDLLLTPEGARGVGGPLPLHRAELHQAAGALTVRLGLPIDQALARLRGYAFAHDRPILDVARDVVHRHALLDD